MLSRTELQTRSNLSRKAIRVYEEKGLLAPQILANGRAVYDEADVERAIFIATLREVGISISVIHRLLDPMNCTDGFLLNSLTKDLADLAANAVAAIELIEYHNKTRMTEIFEKRYGDFWTIGLERTINISDTVAFIEEMVQVFEQEGLDTSATAALYSEETDKTVRLRVFKEVETTYRPKNPKLQKYFLPQHTYFAMTVTGYYGVYDCFDEAYAKIDQMHAEKNRAPPPFGAIEVYKSYPSRGSPGQAFETLVMA